MKKITLTLAVIAFSIATVFAQDKALKDIQKVFIINKFADAKQMTDALIKNSKYDDNAEAWLWKSTIDAVVFQDEKLSATCPTCLESCFEAFKKYEALEPDYASLGSFPFNWRPIGVLYDNYYNAGVTAYKAKDYEKAYTNFDKCAQVATVMMKKDLKKNGGLLDTIPFLYAGYAAQNAKKNAEAIKYFSILADYKYAVKDDVDIYKYLLISFSEANDKENFDKYLTIAQEVFPAENFQAFKMDYMNRHSNLDDKLALYNSEDAKGSLSVDDYLNFGSMFYNHTKEEREMLDKDPAKKAVLHTKAREAFAKAYEKDKQPLTAFNVGLIYFSEFNEAEDKKSQSVKTLQDLNTNKLIEKDPKKKTAAEAKFKEQTDPVKAAIADAENKMLSIADKVIEWQEIVYNALKDKPNNEKAEKSSYKNALKFLGNMYDFKREKVKGKDPKAYDAFDAKSKFYFDLYDKSK